MSKRRHASVQINFELTDKQYSELISAAKGGLEQMHLVMAHLRNWSVRIEPKERCAMPIFIAGTKGKSYSTLGMGEVLRVRTGVRKRK